MKCNHNESDLSIKNVCMIFAKHYRTVLLWLHQDESVNTATKILYKNGKFPNAYKCKKCGRIIIPSDDVSKVLEQMKNE